MTEEDFEIVDRSHCTFGLRSSKYDELGKKYNPYYSEDNIQIYLSDAHVGLSVDVTPEEAEAIRDKLNELLKELGK